MKKVLIGRTLAATCLVLVFAKCGAATTTNNKAAPTAASTGTGTARAATSNATSSATGTTQVATVTIDFTATIDPIIVSSCGGSACHGIGAGNNVFQDAQALVVSDGPNIVARLTSTDSTLAMPIPGYPQTLSDANRTTLLTYLAQEGVTAAAAIVGTSVATGTNTSTNTGTPIIVAPTAKLCVNLTAGAKASGLAMTFGQVDPVLSASCGGGGCHSPGAGQTDFVDTQGTFENQTNAAAIVADLQSGAMPIGGKTISASDKANVIAYLCGRYDI